MTQSAQSPLWRQLAERADPSPTAFLLPESESVDSANSVAALRFKKIPDREKQRPTWRGSGFQSGAKPIHQIHAFMEHCKDQRALVFPDEVENVVMLDTRDEQLGPVL